MIKKTIGLIFLILIYYQNVYAKAFEQSVSYEDCFTPGADCTGELIREINLSKKSLYIQAYSFTSKPIIYAVIDAKKRGLDVQVILDKSQIKAKGSAYTYLLNANIPVLIDSTVRIAHNKIMIFDSRSVLTGSFNFTKSAQEKNAENFIIINDANLAKEYEHYFFSRKNISISGEQK